MRIAVITGASSGIGKEFARTLKNHGTYDEVWAIARNEERLEALREEIPFPVRAVSLDLSERQSIDRYSELLQAEKPEIALLMNCSGYGKFGAADQIDYAEEIGMIDLNVRALTEITIRSLPYMQAGGEIVEIASMASFQPTPYMAVYAASKAYVLSFSRALNREVKKRGIHVLAVCPYWTKTRFFDRAKAPEEEIVKKYAVMYEPSFIVEKSWKALEKKKDLVIPGFIAKGQALLVKLLPHGFVMNTWLKQQKL